ERELLFQRALHERIGQPIRDGLAQAGARDGLPRVGDIDAAQEYAAVHDEHARQPVAGDVGDRTDALRNVDGPHGNRAVAVLLHETSAAALSDGGPNCCRTDAAWRRAT